MKERFSGRESSESEESRKITDFTVRLYKIKDYSHAISKTGQFENVSLFS